MMRLTPPPNSEDSRVMNFNFIEAVTKLPIRFSKKDLAHIMKSASGKFKGQLRSLFVVISDDQRDQGLRRRDRDRAIDAPPDRTSARGSRASRSSSSSSSGSESSGSDHERAGAEGDSTRRPSTSRLDTEPSMPPPAAADPPSVRSELSSGRGSKRGHTSPKSSRKTKTGR